jgi:hypothetical protein
MKFKVGDKIKVINLTYFCTTHSMCGYFNTKNCLGQTGTIVEIEGRDNIRVQHDSISERCWYREADLTLFITKELI